MSRFDPVDEPQPMHISIAASIREAIRRGELKIGERLPLEEIAKEFGVSRQPVREALIRLEKEQLIVFYNRRGAQVAGITSNQVREISDLRCLLETDALRCAAKKYLPADFKNARSVLKQAMGEKDANKLADLHWQFHHSLYSPAKRPLQLEMIDTLHANMDRLFRLEWQQAGLTTDWIDEHYRIVDFLEQGNTENAIEMIETHMRDATARVLRALNQL